MPKNHKETSKNAQSKSAAKAEKEKQLPPTLDQLLEIGIAKYNREEINVRENEKIYFSHVLRIVVILCAIDALFRYASIYSEEDAVQISPMDLFSIPILLYLFVRTGILLAFSQVVCKSLYIDYVKKQIAKENREIADKEMNLETREQADALFKHIEQITKKPNAERFYREYQGMLGFLSLLYVTTFSPDSLTGSLFLLLQSEFLIGKMAAAKNDVTEEFKKKYNYFISIFPQALRIKVSRVRVKPKNEENDHPSSIIHLDIGFYEAKPKSISALISAQIVKNVLLKFGFNIYSIQGNILLITGAADSKNITVAEVKTKIQKAFSKYINSKDNRQLLTNQLEQIAKAINTACYPLLEKDNFSHKVFFHLGVSKEFKDVVNRAALQILFPDCKVSETEKSVTISGEKPADEKTFASYLEKIKKLATEIEKVNFDNEDSAAANAKIKDGKTEIFPDLRRNSNKRISADKESNDKNTSIPAGTTIDWGKGIRYDSEKENCPVTEVWGKNAPPNYYSFFALKKEDFTGHNGEIMYKKFYEQHKSGHLATSDEREQGIILFTHFREARDRNGKKFLATAELKTLGDFGSTGNCRVFGEVEAAPEPNSNAKVIVWKSYDDKAHKDRNSY